MSGLGGRTHSAPDQPALVCGGHSLSFAELEDLQARLAGFLGALSFRTGDRVAVLASNSIEFLVVTVGCLRAGIVPVPISPLLTESEHAHLLEDSGARLLFSDREHEISAPVERICVVNGLLGPLTFVSPDQTRGIDGGIGCGIWFGAALH